MDSSEPWAPTALLPLTGKRKPSEIPVPVQSYLKPLVAARHAPPVTPPAPPVAAPPAPTALPVPNESANAQPAPTAFIELQGLQQSHLETPNKLLDIMGTVISYTRPKRCKGRHEWMSSIVIVDPSLPAGRNVCLNYFGSTPELHPRILAIGDIILCRKLKVQIYQNEPQLVGNTDFKSTFTTFHRNINHSTGFPVDAAAGGEWGIHRTSNKTDYNAADTAAKDALHRWTADALMRTLLGEDRAENVVTLQALYRRTMSPEEVGEGALPKDIDVTCVVVKTIECGADLLVLVWDGTTPGRLFDGRTEIGEEAYASLHASLHASTVYLDCIDSASMAAMQPRVLNSDTAPKNLLGCCVALTFLAAKAALHAPTLLPGTWIRLRNLSTDTRDATSVPPVVGLIKPDTYVNILVPYARNVTAVASRYLQRTQAGDYATAKEAKEMAQAGRATSSSSSSSSRGVVRPQFTACGKPYTPLSLCMATPAPAKYCVLGRITDFWPKDLGKFVMKEEPLTELLPRAGVPVTSTHSGYIFAFSVLLVDDTAAHSVIVFGKDAEFFLGGITPSQFKTNQGGVQETVARRLRDVISEGTKFDFYIRTYTSSDPAAGGGAFIPEDSPEVKRAQVFGTNIMA